MMASPFSFTCYLDGVELGVEGVSGGEKISG